MATDVVDDQEMREAQRDYLDFLDDDVSLTFIRLHVLPWGAIRNHVVTTKELTLAGLVRQIYTYEILLLTVKQSRVANDGQVKSRMRRFLSRSEL